MASKLPCCLAVEKYQWVLVDGRDGREEWHCPTCGKLCAEGHGTTLTLSPHFAALIAASDGDGPASNPAPVLPFHLNPLLDKITDHPPHLSDDFEKAVQWYHLVAGQGRPDAQANLGVLYCGGFKGVPQDDKEAARWFRLSAEQGNATGQLNLGIMYYMGKGVPEDIEEAARWFRLAAEQGKTEAQANLGTMNYLGEGVPQDDVLSHMWLSLAVLQGDKDVSRLRDDLVEKMTPAQIAKAEKLAREWKPKK